MQRCSRLLHPSSPTRPMRQQHLQHIVGPVLRPQHAIDLMRQQDALRSSKRGGSGMSVLSWAPEQTPAAHTGHTTDVPSCIHMGQPQQHLIVDTAKNNACELEAHLELLAQVLPLAQVAHERLAEGGRPAQQHGAQLALVVADPGQALQRGGAQGRLLGLGLCRPGGAGPWGRPNRFSAKLARLGAFRCRQT